MLKICIVTGARPNFIKVAPLMRTINKMRDNGTDISCQLIYTGSKDDITLESSLFDDLQMPYPDVFLGVMEESINELTARVMSEFDQWLDKNPTDIVIVVDDLASAMAASIVAKKRGLTLAHIVAGTRSFDINMPKEINRLVIDSLSDLLFTAGANSNGIAKREGQDAADVYMVGNILIDTLRYNRSRLRCPEIANQLQLKGKDYLLLTINRKAIINNQEKLTSIIQTICESANGVPVIAPLRENARKAVSHLTLTNLNLHVVAPLSYLEFGYMSEKAMGIITDSGNVAEEATFNSVPCITLNNYTEHLETVNIGSNVLVGEDINKLSLYVSELINGNWKKCALPDRWDGRTAERIIRILLEKEL